MAVKFVVNLPADHGRMSFVMFGKHLGDVSRFLLINRRGIIVVAPGTVGQACSCETDARHFWVTLGQPRRRRVGGRAHDRLKSMALAKLKCTIEEGKVVATFLRFPDAPSPFSHPDDVHPGLDNSPKVGIPLGFWPLLWIVNDAVE